MHILRSTLSFYVCVYINLVPAEIRMESSQGIIEAIGASTVVQLNHELRKDVSIIQLFLESDLTAIYNLRLRPQLEGGPDILAVYSTLNCQLV